MLSSFRASSSPEPTSRKSEFQYMPINFGIVQTEIIWKTIDFVSIANYAVAKFNEYFFSSPELKAFLSKIFVVYYRWLS